MGYEKFKRPLDLRTGASPDLLVDQFRWAVTDTTAASTALATRGVVALHTTSTDETVTLHTLAQPKTNDVLILSGALVQTTSSPIHVNAQSGGYFGLSTEGMITISSQAASVILVARSSVQWLPIGEHTVSISSST